MSHKYIQYLIKENENHKDQSCCVLRNQ